jgi:hypothetical protein
LHRLRLSAFPAVREQLSVDGCARKLLLNDSGIEAADVRSLQLLLSDEAVSNFGSQLLQSGFLEKENLKRGFLRCSKADVRMNLSDLEFANLSAEDFSELSFLFRHCVNGFSKSVSGNSDFLVSAVNLVRASRAPSHFE